MAENRRIARRTFAKWSSVALLPTAWLAWERRHESVKRQLDRSASRCIEKTGERDGAGGVGVVATRAMALLRCGRSESDPTTASGLEFLEAAIQPDGGVYSPGQRQEIHETCLAMLAFHEANVDRRYDQILRSAAAFAGAAQWQCDKSDPANGGIGSGLRARPDLLTTATWLEAMTGCGGEPSDGSVPQAIAFVSRCQEGGGFRWSSDRADRRPSCGVTTCIGLLSLLLAGVGRDDRRVQSALTWLGGNFDARSNPGFGSSGLFHYYHVCARTLRAMGIETIADAAGIERDWRNELCTEIVHRQRDDGSWRNENGCLLECYPQVATAHAVMALACCRRPDDGKPPRPAAPDGYLA